MSFRLWMPVFAMFLAMSVPLAAVAGGGGGTDIERDTVGVVRGIGGSGAGNPARWFLRSSNDPACTTPTIAQFGFGDDGDVVLSVDLTGDGLDQATVFQNLGGIGVFYVRDNNSSAAAGATRISFGAGTDIPIAGNFDLVDDAEEVGVYRPSTNQFFLNNDSGLVSFSLGTAGDVPVVGNWDGSSNGSDEVGVYRPSTNQFFLRADNLPGAATITTRTMGAAGDTPVVGDWDGDDATTIGVFRDLGGAGGIYHYLNNMATGGSADIILGFGATGVDRPVQGDWDGPTVDEDGCP